MLAAKGYLKMERQHSKMMNSSYNGSLTREQFLFHEMRTTARLLQEGMPEDEAIQKIVAENLFQYPTERQIRNIAKVCISRLHVLDDSSLIEAIATYPSETAKQICLYAMMLHNRLVWDFMLTVIGDKYRQQDLSFSKLDVNVFMMRLQEQDDHVATWKESTVNKIKQVLIKILVENGYLDSNKADRLNTVLISPVLESAIKNHNHHAALAAFNCFM